MVGATKGIQLDKLWRAGIVLLLIGACWSILASSAEVTMVPIKRSLSLFPQTIGEYRLSNSLQSSAEVIELLGVDDYIQYDYIDPAGNRTNLYVGYYKAVGVSGSYHSPKNCLPGGGWGIDTIRQLPLAATVKGGATVSEMLIREGSDYQVVLYWYQNRGRIIASEYWEKVYQVIDALLLGRRDGAFIRVMSAVPAGEVAATQERVQAFAEKVLPILEQHLPGRRL